MSLTIDTNILVRRIVSDDPKQAEIARELFATEDIFIPNTVLLESEWVLRTAFGFTKEQINLSFRLLVEENNVTLEHPQAVQQSLEWHAQNLDFADALHLAQARGNFATFDTRLVKRAAKLESAPLIYTPA